MTRTNKQLFPIPGPVRELLDRLFSHGKKAYLVGGCVRDLLLGLSPHDYDITTDASPEEMLAVFSDLPVFTEGIRYGTVGVGTAVGVVECTPFRGEAAYHDGRHPEAVTFGVSLEEDLRRRDFTMNAVCLDRDGILFDPLNGAEDIRRGVIRAVGNPDARFSEDALRILRAIRFSCTLGFATTPDTAAAMERCAGNLFVLPRERVSGELLLILQSCDPARFFLTCPWCFSALFPLPLPEWPERLNLLPCDAALRLLVLDGLAAFLTLPKTVRKDLDMLIPAYRQLPLSGDIAARLLVCDCGYDVAFTAASCYDRYHGATVLPLIEACKNLPLGVRALPLSGADLGAMGFEGAEIGKALTSLSRLVAADPASDLADAAERLLNTALVARLMPEKLASLYGIAPFSGDLFPVRSAARLPATADSVLVFALPYYSPSAAGGNLSKYAAVPDYHLVVPDLLSPVAQALRITFPQHRFEIFTDSSPNKEIPLAVQAGLGKRGDSGLLIHQKYGTFVFLAEIVTDLPLFSSPPPRDPDCPHCGRCMGACPVGLDKEQCVSAVTQKKGELTDEEMRLIKAGGLVWGCDRCQDCCPFNENPVPTPFPEFYDTLSTLTGDGLAALCKTRAFGFRGPAVLRRNLAILQQEADDENLS